MIVKKTIYILIGIGSFIIGVVGAVLPIVPTFPFMILSGFCFGKSSHQLNGWFRETKLYKKHLDSYIKGQGMTKKTKVKTIIMVTTLLAFGFIMMDGIFMGRILLVIVWLFHMIYFSIVVKTKSESA